LMMLSSDGLHGVVPVEQIEAILGEPDATVEEKCRELISAANDAGSPDNVTVLLIRRPG
jgi:serine/threonine protein phosphatase PrpC